MNATYMSKSVRRAHATRRHRGRPQAYRRNRKCVQPRQGGQQGLLRLVAYSEALEAREACRRLAPALVLLLVIGTVLLFGSGR